MPLNLIQNYVTNKTSYVPPSEKEAPEFDIHQELANKTFIKPLQGRGKLVKGRILDAPTTMVKSLAYDVNALQHGWNGEANDHQLGKLNDVGMKIGGLAIAGYLFTKRQTPLTKAMEFVGLGSFFASMALWPKLAIQLPARLIHGVDVQKQYEDSFGRKKPFYQDPQFLPWDLYSDKDINKMGDRLGVPKNIPNRREFIQEKMKKIAVQNNTLWMLTAGFATPIMSALICNRLEGPLAKLQNNIKSNRMDNLLAHFQEAVKDERNNSTINAVDEVLSISKNQPITDSLIHDLSKALTKNFDLTTTTALEADLKLLLTKDTFVINKNVVNTMVKKTNDALEEVLDKKALDALLPTQGQLTEYFEQKGYFGNDYTRHKMDDIFTEINDEISAEISEFNQNNPTTQITKAQIKKINKVLVGTETAKNPIMQALLRDPYARIDGPAQKLIRQLAVEMSEFKANVATLDKYAWTKTGAAPETVLANEFNETVESVMKVLNITDKELTRTRGDRELIAELTREKFDLIASNKDSYNKVVKTVINRMVELENKLKPSDISDKTFGKQIETAYEKRCNTVFESFGKKFSEMGLSHFTDRLLGKTLNSNKDVRVKNGSLKHLQKQMVADRLLGVKSSFYRIINTLDLYRRIALGNKNYLQSLHEKMPREVKEEVVELSKMVSVQGHSSDYLTKFFMLRNAFPDEKDLSDIEVKNGRTVYKYFQKGVTEGKVDIPQDVTQFKETMRLMFQNPMLPETEKAFTKYTTILEEMKSYRKTSLYNLGNSKYFARKYHMAVDGIGEVVSTNESKFNLTGMAIDEMLSNKARQLYNTRKWLKIFGTMGAGLLGITVGAQFFFGRMKPPKETVKETKKG